MVFSAIGRRVGLNRIRAELAGFVVSGYSYDGSFSVPEVEYFPVPSVLLVWLVRPCVFLRFFELSFGKLCFLLKDDNPGRKGIGRKLLKFPSREESIRLRFSSGNSL